MTRPGHDALDSAIPAALSRDEGRMPTARLTDSMIRLLDRCAPVWLFLLIVATYTLSSRGDWLIDFSGADNWSYLYYFLSWGSPSEAMRTNMATDYKASRLPWILPGYAYLHLFGDVYGPYLLHISVLGVTAWSFYTSLKSLFDRRIAIIVMCVILIDPYFHSTGIPGFWFYHGQAALMYFALACTCIIIARGSKRPYLLHMLAGSALASSIITSLTLVLFLPAFGALLLLLVKRPILRQAFLASVAMLLGASLSLIGCALVSALAGGPWLFLRPQIVFALGSAASGGVWIEPFPDWFPKAKWLAFPLAILMATVAALVISWTQRRGSAGYPDWRTRATCAVPMVLAVAVCVAAEARGQPILQSYIAHQLYAPSTLALGLVLSTSGRSISTSKLHLHVALVVGAIVPLIAIPATVRAAILPGLMSGSIAGLTASLLWIPTAMLLASVGLLAACFRLGSVVSLLLSGMVLGTTLAVIAPAPWPHLAPSPCESRRITSRLAHQFAHWGLDDDRKIAAGFLYQDGETADRDACPAMPLRGIYTAAGQVALPRVFKLERSGQPDYTSFDRQRDWPMIVIAATPENTTAIRARFESWMAGSPHPMRWHFTHEERLEYEGVTIRLSIYER
jgi:hypothetical protein